MLVLTIVDKGACTMVCVYGRMYFVFVVTS